jgi:hypothetical protein
MRPVVLDTSVVLPAVLSPRGYRWRFLVVLALGALAARRELLHQETDMLRPEAASTGGQPGGTALNALAEQTEARYTCGCARHCRRDARTTGGWSPHARCWQSTSAS